MKTVHTHIHTRRVNNLTGYATTVVLVVVVVVDVVVVAEEIENNTVK